MIDKEKAYEYWCEWQDEKRPTEEQIACAEALLQKLGYDVDDYAFEEMTKWEVEDLISGLRLEAKNEVSA